MNIMGKRAISVTLESANLTWLRGCVASTGARSVSALLDRLIAEARAGGVAGPVRSVVGTIDLDASDPLLLGADAAVGAAFAGSLGRPPAVHEREPRDGRRRRTSRRG